MQSQIPRAVPIATSFLGVSDRSIADDTEAKVAAAVEKLGGRVDLSISVGLDDAALTALVEKLRPLKRTRRLAIIHRKRKRRLRP